jgi:hypothetical protein
MGDVAQIEGRSSECCDSTPTPDDGLKIARLALPAGSIRRSVGASTRKIKRPALPMCGRRVRCEYWAMSVLMRDGAARRLVVEPGGRVRATGRFVSFPDGDWLDLAQVHLLILRAAPWKSPRSFRLIGVDANAVPDGSDPSVVRGSLQVVGVWHDDVIEVDTQAPVPSPAWTPLGPLFIGAEPAGGWDGSQQSTDVEGLQQLREAGQIVRDGWLRTDNGALILRIAACDVDAVEAILAPELPRRLHVVRSRYTVAHLREVEEMFTTHHSDWGFESWSYQSLDPRCQPYAEATLTRVCSDLAAWADTLPDDLLRLTPAMTPA